MAKRKVTKKIRATQKSVRKVIRKRNSRTVRTGPALTRRGKQSKVVSFFIGVLSVLLLGFLIFQYSQTNNYKQVLGQKTEILKQQSK